MALMGRSIKGYRDKRYKDKRHVVDWKRFEALPSGMN